MDIRERSYWRHVGVTSLSGGSNFQTYYSDMAQEANTTQDNLHGIIALTPYWSGPRSGSVLDRIAIGLTTQASQQVRLGIYQNVDLVSSVYPGALIYASPELSTATVGLLTNSINLTLVSDTLYWFAATTSGTTAQFTCAAQDNWCVPLLLGAYNAFNTRPLCYAITTAYASLPSTVPAGAVVAQQHVPILAVRYSG